MAQHAATVLIVGAGPAGMAAALSVARQQQTAILFDDGTYCNDRAEYMHLLPGFDHVRPADYRKAARANLLANYAHVRFADVAIVRAAQDAETGGFTLTDAAGTAWTGQKLVLATGVEDVPLALAGYADCWGKAIFHCLFCKGYEQRGASSGVLAVGALAQAPMALHMARQASTLSSTVTIYTNGGEEEGLAITAGLGTATTINVDTRPLARLELLPDGGGIRLVFADGTSADEAFLAHTPATRLRGPLAAQLGLARTPGGDIQAAPPFSQASVAGVFVAGDASGGMKNVPGALFSGSLAGMGASAQAVAEALGQAPLFK